MFMSSFKRGTNKIRQVKMFGDSEPAAVFELRY